MKYCERCGANIVEGQNFCPQCGNDVTGVVNRTNLSSADGCALIGFFISIFAFELVTGILSLFFCFRSFKLSESGDKCTLKILSILGIIIIIFKALSILGLIYFFIMAYNGQI